MSSLDLSHDNPPDVEQKENCPNTKGQNSSETCDKPQKEPSNTDGPTKATATTGGPPNPNSRAVPDVSYLAISTEPDPNHRPSNHLPVIRSVSDTGPQRLPAPRIESSRSSGNGSPLAHIQTARSGGLAARPPSSSGSGVSKLPAEMQAKMMAVFFPVDLC